MDHYNVAVLSQSSMQVALAGQLHTWEAWKPSNRASRVSGVSASKPASTDFDSSNCVMHTNNRQSVVYACMQYSASSW